VLIPSAKAQLLRDYQSALFYQITEPKNERQYVFYLLLRPLLLWVRDTMIDDCLLEPAEAESELYLLCCKIFDDFDKEKSSIIPYLRKAIPWKVHHLLRKLKRVSQREIPSGLTETTEDLYETDEEYYWKIPEMFITDRFIGKLFTIREKYYIYKILVADNDKLTQKDLAKSCKVSRPTMNIRLSELKEALVTGGYNGTTQRRKT